MSLLANVYSVCDSLKLDGSAVFGGIPLVVLDVAVIKRFGNAAIDD